MKQFLQNHGLFAALLTASFVGHVSVKWLGPIVSMEPQLARVESGRNSVSVQLIAVQPERSDPAEIEAPAPLPPDRSHLVDEAAPDQALETDSSDLRVSTPMAIVTASTTSSPETAFQNLSSSRLPQRAEPDPQPSETARAPQKTVRRRPDRAIELADAEIEIPYTVQSEQSAGDEVPPSFASRPLPAYPADLLLQRVEGTVELLVTIGVDGRVVKAKLHRSSGYAAMDRSALETIYRWTFTPARRGDTPIAKRAIVPIDFTIPN